MSDNYQVNKTSDEAGDSMDAMEVDPLDLAFEAQSRFKFRNSELCKITALDHHHKEQQDREGESFECVISSRIIIEDFGGQNAIIEALDTNTETGISGTAEDLAQRRAVYGPNSFPPPKIKSLMEIICANFEDFINQVLLVACVVSLIIGIVKEGLPDGLIEGTSIMIALTIIIVVGSGNEYVATQRLASMIELQNKAEATVYRGSNEPQKIDANDLVVGDLIEFDDGMKVPADVMMISGANVKCKEDALTGEADEFVKEPITEDNWKEGAACVMYAKSTSNAGCSGRGVVLSVGLSTAAGVIAKKTTEGGSKATPLQEKLETIANTIGNVGGMMAILTLLAQFVRILLEFFELMPCGCMNLFTCVEVEGCVPYDFTVFGSKVYIEILNAIIISITVVVVAIPEGLPLAVTIALSFASAIMYKENNLVREPSSAETMGGASFVCSDKTGTLTMNQMTVMGAMTCGKVHLCSSVGETKPFVEAAEQDFASVTVGDTDKTLWETLKESILWNLKAFIEKNPKPKAEREADEQDDYLVRGNITDQGCVKFFREKMGDEPLMQFMSKTKEAGKLLHTITFSSKRKKASIVVHQPDHKGTDKEVRVYCKGGPDFMLRDGLVSNIVKEDGSIVELGDKVDEWPEKLIDTDLNEDAEEGENYEQMIQQTISLFAAQAYRTILTTYRDMSMEEWEGLKDEDGSYDSEETAAKIETGLTAIGIFGLEDPLKPGIQTAIKQCQTAGIRVIMCTGDNIETATAISLNAGIVTKEKKNATKNGRGYACMTGEKFREFVGGIKTVTNNDGESEDLVANMQNFRKVFNDLCVLARCSPEDKYLLVTGIQAMRNVVAVTGDGTNDAPALTKADVGFAMGIAGTDVAKGASNIILMDDNFSSIVVALKYGRSVYDNVRKFLQFQLTVNVVAMFIVFLGAVILKDAPLNAVQMLWVNLIMDTFAALALATEPPESSVLTRQPYPKDSPIVTEVMWRNVFGHAIYQSIVLIVLIFAVPGWLCVEYDYPCVEGMIETRCDAAGYTPFFTKSLYYHVGDTDWPGPTEDDEAAADYPGKNAWMALRYPMTEEQLNIWRCESFKLYNEHAFSQLVGVSNPDEGCNCNLEEDRLVLAADADYISSNMETTFPYATEGDHAHLNQVPTQKTLHFTIVFQAFVFMQVFNQINARKIFDGEFNVFEGIFDNKLFSLIVLITIIVQVVMVEVGGKAVKTYPLGIKENLWCLLIGFIEMPWGFFLKFLPLKWFSCLHINDTPPEGGIENLKGISTIVKSRSRVFDK